MFGGCFSMWRPCAQAFSNRTDSRPSTLNFVFQKTSIVSQENYFLLKPIQWFSMITNMNFVKHSVRLSCILKVCPWSVLSVTVCYGESRFKQTESLLGRILQLALFLSLLFQPLDSLLYKWCLSSYCISREETFNAMDLCRFLIPKTEVNVFPYILSCLKAALCNMLSQSSISLCNFLSIQ